MTVIAAQMLDAQLDSRRYPLRRRPLLHGLGPRPGVFLDTLPQPFLHVSIKADERRTDILPCAGFG